MEEEKKGNLKILWIVLFAVVAVIFCYLFVVLYFFYISPNNISVKLTLWPFLSDTTIGELYLDAMVDIQYTKEVDFEPETVNVVGVNVRSDGYIVTSYSELQDCEDGNFKIITNSGSVYNGVLVFSDINFDLAILKCESITGNEEISIPYVKVSSSTFSYGYEVLAVSSPLNSKSVWTGIIIDNSTDIYAVKDVEYSNNSGIGFYTAVDFVVENCYILKLNESSESYIGGAIFNDSGSLIGISYQYEVETDDSTSYYAILPTTIIKTILDDVVESYESGLEYSNTLVESFVGLDGLELYIHKEIVSQLDEGNTNSFYFNGEWIEYTDEILQYFALNSFDTSSYSTYGYFLLEDFSYEDVSIVKNSVIVSITVDGTACEISTKTDLFNLLYTAEEGDSVTISYFTILNGNTEEDIVSVTFTV